MKKNITFSKIFVVCEFFLELKCYTENCTEKDDCIRKMTSRRIKIFKIPRFYCKQNSRFIFKHLMLKKSAITEYITDVRTIVS